MAISKVAVIGSGVMGGGIAAHVANAGVPVLLLDIVPPGAKNRNVVAEQAIEVVGDRSRIGFGHEAGASFRDRVGNGGRQPRLLAHAAMGDPFVLRGPMARCDEDRELLELVRQAAIEADARA